MYTNYNIPQNRYYKPGNYYRSSPTTTTTYYQDEDRFFGGGFLAPFLLGGVGGYYLVDQIINKVQSQFIFHLNQCLIHTLHIHQIQIFIIKKKDIKVFLFTKFFNFFKFNEFHLDIRDESLHILYKIYKIESYMDLD